MAVFEDLNVLNINGHTEKKQVEGKELTYLSWPWAWAEVKKRYPDAHYTIWKSESGLPYTEDPMTGYMVYTSVTIDGVTHEMWLPVMDGKNRAMKRAPYEYTTKYGKKSVEAATMMDINKTIMRCLVKNLAMFGLGLYIYAGEDLPEAEQEAQEQADQKPPKAVTSAPQRKNAAVKAEIGTVNKLPQAAPQAPVQAEKPAQAATPGAYLQMRIGEMKAKYANFNFMSARKALIDGGIVPDIPSATMTMEQAVQLMDAVDTIYRTPQPKVS